MSVNRRMDKENMIHTHIYTIEYYSAIKKNEILPFATIWMDFEVLCLVIYVKQRKQNTVLVQFSHSIVSNSLQPHGLLHVRLPCPSPTPGTCSNSCPLSQWCHPTISSSVVPFFSWLQSVPASGFFLMSQFFTVSTLPSTVYHHF